MSEGVVMSAWGGPLCEHGKDFANICGECLWSQLCEHGNNYVNGRRSCERWGTMGTGS